MKKRALKKDFRMEIKKSMNRFLSIFLIVALGVSFFAGLQSAAPDMRVTQDTYYDDANLMDIRVLSTMGLTEDDVEAIAAVDGVAAAEGTFSEDVYSGDEESQAVLHVEAFPETMNQVAVTAGSLPTEAGECFLDQGYADSMGYEPGDVLEITVEDEDDSLLVHRELTITGTGYSPCYIAVNQRGSTTLGTGTVSGFVYVTADEFDSEVYTVVYVQVEGAKEEMSYTDAYDDLVEEVLERIEAIEDVRCEARYTEIIEEAQAEIDDAKQEVEDGKQELEDAKQEVEDGKLEVEDAKQELEDAKAEAESELAEAESELLDAEEQLADGRQELEDAKAEIADAESEVADGEAELESNEKKLLDAQSQLSDALDTLKEGEAEYWAGWRQYQLERYAAILQLLEAQEEIDSGTEQVASGWTQYYAGLSEVSSGETQIAAAEAQIASAQSAYEAGVAELAESQSTYEASVAEVEEGWTQLEAGKTELAAQQSTYDSGRAALDEVWASYNSAAAELAAGQSAYDTAAAQVAELRSGYETATATVSTLQSSYDAAVAQVSAFSAQVAALNEEIASLQTQIDAAGEEEDTSELEAQLAADQAALSEAETALATVNAQVAALPASISEAQATAEALQVQLAEAESTLAAQKTELDTAAATLAATKEQLDAQETELSSAKAQLDAATAQIEATEAELTAAEEELASAATQLEEGQAQLDASAAQIASAQTELNTQKQTLAAARTTLATTKTQLESSEAELEEAQAEVDAGYEELASAEAQLAEGRTELDDGWEQYYTARVEYESGLAEFEEGRAELEDAKAELEDARQEIADAEAEIAENEQTIADGWADYEEGKAEAEQEIADAEAEIADAEQEIADAEQEIADAEAEIADAEQEIADAEAEIADISYPSWYVYDRSSLPENTGYSENADRMNNIAQVFPVIFFLVAALISLTTMTRMVEEERTQIGTLKALGYGKWDIAKKYLKYAFWATICGSIFGVLFGEKLFPWVIISAYEIMYVYQPAILVPYNLEYGVIATGIALVCTVGAAFSACYRALGEVPAQLMRPPAPKDGKRVLLERVPFIWKHLNFNWKSTVRNLMRYKRRLLMTVLGIGGCMGLLLVGYGLRDSIGDIGALQFDELQTYDAMLIYDTDADEEEMEALEETVASDGRIGSWKRFYMQSMDIEGQDTSGTGKQWTTYIYVPEDTENISDYLTFRSRTSDEEYTLTDEGAIITEKIATEFGLSVGDSISIRRDTGDVVSIPIAAICENYLYHYVYLTPTLYEEVFGEAPEYNSIFFCLDESAGDADTEEGQEILEEIGTALLTCEAAVNITYIESLAETIDTMLSALDLVIIVLIVSAGLLAFVVQYNLNNININERRRELATLKVLGFFDGEVSMYIYRENIVNTILGAGAGALIGLVLHRFVILTVEVDSCMFGRSIYPMSYVYSILFTVAFSIIVNAAMHFKLKKIDMVESLKSIE